MNPLETPASFASLGLDPLVEQAVRDVGYEAPSQIQAESIPPLLAGRDLLGQAQTGTGKTAAFALPLLSRLDRSRAVPQVLVLAPTRELALQVAEAFGAYARHFPDFHILPMYGGQGMAQQLRALQRGVHVVVGTPGRVMDHVRRKTLKTADIQALVLDEADEMLRMGFAEDLDEILRALPASRQTALFSATLPAGIRRIATGHLKDPVTIQIRTSTATVSTVEQTYWLTTGTHKLDGLTRILEAEEIDAVLIFVRTKNATVELAEKLEARGYRTDALNGDMTQQAREKTITRLRNGALDVVVATDVAARGLDVKRISHVVNYDMPYDTESYVHRIGRTARAGRTGRAILFVAPREKRMLHAIEKATKQTISELQLPTRASIAEKRLARFRDELVQTLSDTANIQQGRQLIEEIQREHSLDLDDLAAGLATLLLAEKPGTVPKGGSVSAGRPADTHREPVRQARPDRDRPRERAPREHSRAASRPSQVDAADERDDHETAPPRKDKKADRPRLEDDITLVPYRLEVGREHGVLPKNIVGAISNEAGLEGRYVVDVQIHDTYSTVMLPEGMPREILAHLKKVRVAEQPLRIQLIDGQVIGEGRAGRAERPRRAFTGQSREESPGRPPRKFTDKPTGKFGDRPPRKFTDKPAGKFGDRPPRKFTDKPAGKFGDRPPRKFTDKPAGKFGDRPPRNFTDKPTGKFGDRPPRKLTDKPTGKFGDRPPRKFTDKPTGKFGDRPPRNFTDKPTGKFGDRPPRKFTDKPTGKFGDRPPRKFTDKPTGKFGDRPPRKFTDKPTGKFGDRPPRKGGPRSPGKPPRAGGGKPRGASGPGSARSAPSTSGFKRKPRPSSVPKKKFRIKGKPETGE